MREKEKKVALELLTHTVEVATLFNGLTSHEMHILAEHAEVCYPEPGEVLAQLGTVIDWLGIVCAGHLQCLSEEGEKLFMIPAGGLVGEMCLLIQQKLSWEVCMSDKEVVMVVLPHQVIARMNTEHPDVAIQLMQICGRAASLKMQRLLISRNGLEQYYEQAEFLWKRRQANAVLADNHRRNLLELCTNKNESLGSSVKALLNKSQEQSKRLINVLDECIKIVAFEKGDQIISKGQLGKHVLIVLQGRVVVTRGLFTSHVEQTFETGSVFGELEYLQSFYLDGFSYARQRNHFSAVLKECTYKLAGTCFENCPSKCHGRKTRDAPRTMLAILDEDVLQKISDRAPELTVALLHGLTGKATKTLLDENNSQRMREVQIKNMALASMKLNKKMKRGRRRSSVASKAAASVTKDVDTKPPSTTLKSELPSDNARLAPGSNRTPGTNARMFDKDAGNSPPAPRQARISEPRKFNDDDGGVLQVQERSVRERRFSGEEDGAQQGVDSGEEVEGRVVTTRSTAVLARRRLTDLATGSVGEGGMRLSMDSAPGSPSSVAGGEVALGDGDDETDAEAAGASGQTERSVDRKLRAARRASGGAKNESKAGLEQQHRRNSTGMTGMDDSALPKGRARRRGSLAVRRHRASLDPANLSAARASAETGPESGAEEAAQAVARPPLDGIPGKRLDVDVYARRAFINTFNEGSRFYGALNEQDLQSIAESTEIWTIPSGELVMQKGDLADSFMLIIKGRISVTIHEDDVRYLGASEFLGHMGFFESMSRRSVDCHTVEETVVAVYKYAQVMELLTKTPKFGVRLVRLLTFAQIDILRNNTKGRSEMVRFKLGDIKQLDRTDNEEWDGDHRVSVDMLKNAGGRLLQLVRAGVSYDKWNKADYEILARSMLKVVLKQEDGSVLRERQEGHCLLFVLKGTLVRRSRNDEGSAVLEYLPPGYTVGGSALLNRPMQTRLLRSDNVYCHTEEVTVGILTFDRLMVINSHNPTLGLQIFISSIQVHLKQNALLIAWIVCNNNNAVDKLRKSIRLKWTLTRLIQAKLAKVRKKIAIKHKQKGVLNKLFHKPEPIESLEANSSMARWRRCHSLVRRATQSPNRDDISATPFSQEFGMNPSAEEAASDDEDDVARGATSPGLGRSLLLLDHLEEDAAFEAPLTISKSSRKLRLVNNSGWGLVTKTMAPNVARERTLGVWSSAKSFMQRADRQPSAGSTSPTAPGKSLATEAEAAAEAEDLQHRAAWLVEMRSAGHEVDARGFLVDVRGNRVVDPQGCFVNAQGHRLDPDGFLLDQHGAPMLDVRGLRLHTLSYNGSTQGGELEDDMRGVPGGEQGLRTHLDGRQVDHEGRHVDEEGFHLGVTGQRISGTARASLHAPRRAQVSDSEGGDLDVAGDPGPSEPQLDPVSNRLSPEHLTEEELQAAMDSIGDNESLSDEQRAYRFVAEALRMRHEQRGAVHGTQPMHGDVDMSPWEDQQSPKGSMLVPVQISNARHPIDDRETMLGRHRSTGGGGRIVKGTPSDFVPKKKESFKQKTASKLTSSVNKAVENDDTEMRQHELFQRLVVGHRNAQVSSVPPGSANADKGGALPKVPQHIQALIRKMEESVGVHSRPTSAGSDLPHVDFGMHKDGPVALRIPGTRSRSPGEPRRHVSDWRPELSSVSFSKEAVRYLKAPPPTRPNHTYQRSRPLTTPARDAPATPGDTDHPAADRAIADSSPTDATAIGKVPAEPDAASDDAKREDFPEEGALDVLEGAPAEEMPGVGIPERQRAVEDPAGHTTASGAGHPDESWQSDSPREDSEGPPAGEDGMHCDARANGVRNEADRESLGVLDRFAEPGPGQGSASHQLPPIELPAADIQAGVEGGDCERPASSQILLESQLQPLPGNSKSGNTLSPLREMISKSGHPSLKFRIDPAMQNHKKSDPYNSGNMLDVTAPYTEYSSGHYQWFGQRSSRAPNKTLPDLLGGIRPPQIVKPQPPRNNIRDVGDSKLLVRCQQYNPRYIPDFYETRHQANEPKRASNFHAYESRPSTTSVPSRQPLRPANNAYLTSFSDTPTLPEYMHKPAMYSDAHTHNSNGHSSFRSNMMNEPALSPFGLHMEQRSQQVSGYPTMTMDGSRPRTVGGVSSDIYATQHVEASYRKSGIGLGYNSHQWRGGEDPRSWGFDMSKSDLEAEASMGSNMRDFAQAMYDSVHMSNERFYPGSRTAQPTFRFSNRPHTVNSFNNTGDGTLGMDVNSQRSSRAVHPTKQAVTTSHGIRIMDFEPNEGFVPRITDRQRFLSAVSTAPVTKLDPPKRESISLLPNAKRLMGDWRSSTH